MDELRPLGYYRWHWQVARADRRWQSLSWYQRGALRELFEECWVEGGVPDKAAELALIVRCTLSEMNEMWAVLRPFFQVIVSPGVLTNKRIERERTQKDSERVVRIHSGRRGGRAKASAQLDLLARASPQSSDDQRHLPDSAAKRPKSKAQRNVEAPAGTCHIVEKRREEKRRVKEENGAAAPPPLLASRDDEQIVIDRWNAFADKVGFPKCVSYNADRQRKLRARLREKGWFDRLDGAFKFLTASTWHRGNPIVFDTFIRPGKADSYFERSAAPASNGAQSRGGARQSVDAAAAQDLEDNPSAGRRAVNGRTDGDEDVFKL
jgi:uncharacterized protein YdaU (DUF1376 family)